MLSAGYVTARLFWNISFIRGIVISLCLVTSTFSHTKIFLTLRRHQSQVQDHVQQPNQTNQPKDKPSSLQCRGVVYKVGCVDCNFVYYGQTDRALETRLKEHKRAVRVGDNNSKVAQHAQHANHFVHSI